MKTIPRQFPSTLFAALVLALPVGTTGVFAAQTARPVAAQASIAGRVIDNTGQPINHATVTARISGSPSATTGSDGRFTLPLPKDQRLPVAVHAEAAGFRAADVSGYPGTAMEIALSPAGSSETVVVTAYGAPVGADDTAASTLLLTGEALRHTSGEALDDRLREVPGFELYRRTSSLVSNPTSQGVSLRGLGSTAASRTLVLSDEDPLNDPYGGWIHWDEIPELAIQSITIVRGGASDLYGSSAIGGVVDVTAARPSGDTFALNTSYGSLHTLDEAALASVHRGPWSALATGGVLDSDGYTLVAPAVRGLVDVRSNLHAENGRVELDRSFQTTGDVFLRGNLLNEARGNGTPLTGNGTRLWRVESGGDWSDSSGGSLLVRLHGLSDHYRQTFSSIAAGRGAETLTRFVETPATELGGTVRWTQALRPNLLALGGADTRDIRAEDKEVGFTHSLPSSLKNISAEQRQTGLYGEVLWTPAKWTLSAGGRVDFFRNINAHQYAPTPLPEPNISQDVFDPRLGVLRHLTPNLALTATAFRAYRAPTQNELYRTGQVGQQTTLANSALESERATGVEGGVHWASPRKLAALQATYFWTEINRPVSTVFQSGTATSTILLRENLGQIQSQGAALGAQLQPGHGLMLDFGYQYAHAVVTAFRPQQTLVGLWIPDVPRHTATGQLRYQHGPGSFTLAARQSGRAFDDSANTFELHSFFVLDAYAEYRVYTHVSAYLSFQNLLNRSIETARTPNLTLGTPFVAQGGVRLNWGRN